MCLYLESGDFMTILQTSFAAFKVKFMQGKWFTFHVLYSVFYAYMIYLSQGDFLRTHKDIWDPTINAQWNRYSMHLYLFILFINLVSFGWYKRSKLILGVSVMVIAGFTYLLPQLLGYQSIYAILIMAMIIKLPKKVITSSETQTEA